ncbi:MAG: alpha-galactosidase, partial [Bacteroidaceae bacterium]|nr:alpha-galactosidase [Bacteroidaceae bacterium]
MILAVAACTLTACQNEATTEQQPTNSEAAHFLPPLMGWSSWNTYHVNISEALIKSQADAMVSTGLKDAGYLYINTDDGFFGWRDETGLMHTHPDRFPNGMKPVA